MTPDWVDVYVQMQDAADLAHSDGLVDRLTASAATDIALRLLRSRQPRISLLVALVDPPRMMRLLAILPLPLTALMLGVWVHTIRHTRDT